ncbi:thioredoxin domain-containing protein [bacterium]|nr:thioredoxin domain-containing protein [bacterium]
MKKSLFVLFLILVSLFSACNKKEESADQNAKVQEDQNPKAEEIYNVDPGTAIFRGPQDAPVTVINFSDFQCPFSKRSVDAMEGILKRYNGKVRYVFKHFPLSFHKWAKQASYAAIAAQNQGKFWEYYAKLYTDVKNINEETIVAYAKELKLDMDKFNADRVSPETAKKVQDDITQGSLFGVRGTPTLFINGIRIVGANNAKIEETIAKQLVVGEQLKAKGVKDPYAEIVKNGKTKFIPPKREPPAVSQDVYKVEIPAHAPVWGADDALVTLVLFDDFECPFCSRLYGTYEQLKQDYEGKIRIAFVNLPLGFHKKAKDAAYLAAAAHKQGKFWEVYSFLFTKQKEWNRVPDFTEWLETNKADIPADWETLKKDMEDKATTKIVEEDIKTATALGLRGTPASFVNGRFISGALPIESFKKVIDEELKKAEGKGLKGDALYREIIKEGKPAIAKANGNKAEKEDPNKVYQIKLSGKEAVKGAKNPKVTIIEFSDFQCPFCSKAFATVESVAGKYKNDVKVVYKNLPLDFHKEAKPAALFARAVKNLYGDEKFFQIASILYAKQNEWNSNSEEKFAAYAKEIGADWAKVKAEAAKPETEEAVSEDIREAGNHNLRGVPAFFVNGKKVAGAKPAEFFENMIESIIKEKK